MLLSRPVVLDLAESTDARIRLDTQLRAATAAPVERHARQAGQVRGQAYSTSKPRRPSSRSRRAATRRKKALAQLVFSLVLLGGFLAYAAGLHGCRWVLAERFTKGLTSSTPSRWGREVTVCRALGDGSPPPGEARPPQACAVQVL
ncbi:MAG TPA: hypothetical protein VK964_17860 [Nocardioidaceae bacterium]|nr:hypothetical protein [Nocardioidaceae bacterium]